MTPTCGEEITAEGTALESWHEQTSWVAAREVLDESVLALEGLGVEVQSSRPVIRIGRTFESKPFRRCELIRKCHVDNTDAFR